MPDQTDLATGDLHLLGCPGLLGAISAADDLLHADARQLASRDQATAVVIARWLRLHPADSR